MVGTWPVGRRMLLGLLVAPVLAGCGGGGGGAGGGGAGGQARQAAAADTGAMTSPQAGGINERLILAAAEIALPPPGVTGADLPDPTSDGAKYLTQFCTTCHNLPSPTIHSATDWPSVARRMWLRIEMLPPDLRVPVPSTEQRQVILKYLLDHALQVSGATLPEGPGRATFSQVCSKCHALPDPRQHGPDDWPTVVMRMEQRMTQMKVDQPPQAQVAEIVTYLQGVSGRRGR